jgi:hypothetical protein
MSDAIHVVCPHCDSVNRLPRERLAAHPKCGQCHSPLFAGALLALDEANIKRGQAQFIKSIKRGQAQLIKVAVLPGDLRRSSRRLLVAADAHAA